MCLLDICELLFWVSEAMLKMLPPVLTSFFEAGWGRWQREPAKRLLGELEDQVLSSQVSGTPKTTFRRRERRWAQITLLESFVG